MATEQIDINSQLQKARSNELDLGKLTTLSLALQQAERWQEGPENRHYGTMTGQFNVISLK